MEAVVEPNSSADRPCKRVKVAASRDRGPDLQADALFKYSLKLPHNFTPGSVQANRIALRVQDDCCRAYVANGQHVYEVLLDLASVTSAARSIGANTGKQGVLVPRNAQVEHIRQLGPLSDMAAEVQSLYSGIFGGHHLLAAVDAVGNTRLLAEPLQQSDTTITSKHRTATGVRDAMEDSNGGGEGCAPRYVMHLAAPSRGECGWTGVAIRSLGGGAAAASTATPGSGITDISTAAAAAGGCGRGGSGGLPDLEVAVARQRMRDVVLYRGGRLVRTLHTMQGPTALTYLPPGGPYGGCADAAGGLLAVAEEHQLVIWDIRQGERGGCIQRLGVYGGGCPLYGINWLSGLGARRQSERGGGGGDGGRSEGLLAAAGGERSVVVLEPRKWQVVAKWPGCVKYPATHLAPSTIAPGFVYVAGLDYECTAGRWDGSSGGSSGNANSGSGGHGRAAGPVQLLAAAAEGDEGPEGASQGGLSFRGDSKWLGLAVKQLPVSRRDGDGALDGSDGGGSGREVVAALSMSGQLLMLVASASSGCTTGAGEDVAVIA